MRDPEERTITAEMLKFYSGKANTHASFIVAEIFGFYALLFNAEALSLFVFIPASLCLILVNLYSLDVFMYYSSIVTSYKNQLLRNMEELEKETFRNLKKGSWHFRISRRVRNLLTKKIKVNTFTLGWNIIIFAFVWFFIILLPFSFVLRSLII